MAAPKFKDLRLLIASFNRLVKAGTDPEATSTESGIIIGLLLEKPITEIEEMRITLVEMTSAMNVVPEICGLILGQKSSGGAEVAAVTASTESTAT